MDPGWLKPRHAAEYAGVSERTVRDWLKDGLSHSRLRSGSILIKRAWIDEYLENFKAMPEIMNKTVDKIAASLVKKYV